MDHLPTTSEVKANPAQTMTDWEQRRPCQTSRFLECTESPRQTSIGSSGGSHQFVMLVLFPHSLLGVAKRSVKPHCWLVYNVEGQASQLVLPSISTIHLLAQEGPEKSIICLLLGLLAQKPGHQNSLVEQHFKIVRVFVQGQTSQGFLGHALNNFPFLSLFFFLLYSSPDPSLFCH